MKLKRILISLREFQNILLKKAITLITNRIRFINIDLIPKEIYKKAEVLTFDIDIDDAEFVALTEHIKGRFWSGDKVLLKGLVLKKWNKAITTEDLYKLIT